MMYINVDGEQVELKTTLGVSRRMEERFKLPLLQIFDKLGTAEINELVELTIIASGKQGPEAKELAQRIMDCWDYASLMLAVEGLLANLMFCGAPDEVEAKLERFPAGEEQKNAMRGFLGLPPRGTPVATGE